MEGKIVPFRLPSSAPARVFPNSKELAFPLDSTHVCLARLGRNALTLELDPTVDLALDLASKASGRPRFELDCEYAIRLSHLSGLPEYREL